MRNALTLTKKETFFLKENRQDPVTGDGFDIGDEIVFCASCKSAFLKESWEYMESKHCGQTSTLRKFPIQSKLTLSKPIVYEIKKADTKSRIIAYLIDNFIAIVLGFCVYFIWGGFENNNLEISPFLMFTGNLYMLFRDIFGVKSSIGKRIKKLYFINTQTQENASTVVLLFRNLIYWGYIILSILIIGFIEIVTGASGIAAMILGFGLVIANIVHLIVLLSNQNHFFDRKLNIELVERNRA